MKHCTIKGCENKHQAKGLCKKHYSRLKYSGKVNESVQERRLAVIKGDTAYIPLGVGAKNGYAIIDSRYSAETNKRNWNKDSRGYACARIKDRYVLLHRLIIDAKKGEIVDHINRNRLDNRTSNLRIATRSQNTLNSAMRLDNTTGYRGVYRVKNNAPKPWYTHLTINGKRINGGKYYATSKEAAARYDELVILHTEPPYSLNLRL